ncbi:MAG TPA: HEAT repeat domain-containing protein [Ignavibacteriaceae bacterium]|nr:HEAT repeat domain-containing protein [Ignavibacteriaceae bacterium]
MALFGQPNIDKLKSKGDIKGLIKLLANDKDNDLRFKAAEALGEIKDLQSIEPLTAVLKDPDKYVRFQAAFAISKIDSKNASAAVPVLIDALEKSYDWAQVKAIEALGKIGDPRAIEPLLTSLKKQYRRDCMRITNDALVRIDPLWKQSESVKSAAQKLLPFLKDRSYEISTNVKKALIMIGEPAVEYLYSALLYNYSGPNHAEEALHEINPDWINSESVREAVPMLIGALKDNDFHIREAAVKLLVRMGIAWRKSEPGKAVMPMFIAALNDSDYHIRWTAVKVLGELGSESVVEPLVLSLKDSDDSVREQAAAALENIDPNWRVSETVKNALPVFIAILNNNSALTRSDAAKALGKIKDASAVDPLINALKDEDYIVRWVAADALGEIKNSSAVNPLVELLHDTDKFVRLHAATALGNIGDPSAVAGLIEALKDEDNNVRRKAAEVLGNFGDSSAIEPLAELLKDEAPAVRNEAEKALKKITPLTFEIVRKYKTIQPGMTMVEVLEILGTPTNQTVAAPGTPKMPQKNLVIWDKPEGKYQLLFEEDILIQVYSRPE